MLGLQVVLACDFINNCRGLRCPVYGVLCDGSAFQFFCFDQSQVPKISLGYFPFSTAPDRHAQELTLPSLRGVNFREFLVCARKIIEAFFYVLLLGYQHSLKVYYENPTEEETSKSELLRSIGHVSEARKKAIEAANLHASGKVNEAELLAAEASAELRNG